MFKRLRIHEKQKFKELYESKKKEKEMDISLKYPRSKDYRSMKNL